LLAASGRQHASEWQAIGRRIAALDAELATFAKSEDRAYRLAMSPALRAN